MAGKIKRLLLLGGRFLEENPYRELIIKRLLEERGIEVVFALPGRGINKGAHKDKSIINDPIFKAENTVLINGDWDFHTHMRHCQMVVFCGWRSYLPLARLAQTQGRLTINFSASTGVDHWIHGVERCLTHSHFSKRYFARYHKTIGNTILPDDEIRVIGSMQHEYFKNSSTPLIQDRETFFRYYNFNPERPIAVLFPKGIASFQTKVEKWFKHWEKSKIDSYNQWLLDKYGEICRQVKMSDYNLLIKLHPSAYVSYNCTKQEEVEFWTQYPWAKVLDSSHTQSMFKHVNVGLGINTHSSLDMAYFNKPFIYVDSDKIEKPSLPQFDVYDLIDLPHGPANRWKDGWNGSNPWFPSWLGGFSRGEKLAECLSDPSSFDFSKEDQDRFIAEFWFKNDGKTSQRIVDEIIAFGQEECGSLRRYLSLNLWRGKAIDLKNRLFVT